MKIIISPAKKMLQKDSLPWRDLPLFLERTEELKQYIQGLSYEEAKRLWKCNDQIATVNYRRFADMNLTDNLTPAILAYEGIQYQYMAPEIFDAYAVEYVQQNLRILSGFYGVLKPFDGVVPYRLEMQAKAAVGDAADLYEFWGDSIYREVVQEDSVILNLASREYAKCVEKYLTDADVMVTCVFGELKDGKVIQKGTMAKMARGEMVRYLAETGAATPEQAKGFDRLGYRFAGEWSDEREYVFIKEICP
ncbi:MAG: peroxide stress protein YaaA [Eubacteriales bacterium]|nr:peroxide stress protein YaaA [Eubacteriales bacterium]